MVTILVPLDRSGFGEAALASLKKLVRTPDDRVVLTQVCAPPDKPYFDDKTPFDEELQTLRNEAEENLREVRLRLKAEAWALTQIDLEVRTGEPVAEIIAAAKESHADLILMATHGRTGLKRVLVGSVAGAVLRSGDLPVVLVRPAELHEPLNDKKTTDQQPASTESA
jgi:nucleotide-binding universal stress UspA family protein